jgi:hypothetical protein
MPFCIDLTHIVCKDKIARIFPEHLRSLRRQAAVLARRYNSLNPTQNSRRLKLFNYSDQLGGLFPHDYEVLYIGADLFPLSTRRSFSPDRYSNMKTESSRPLFKSLQPAAKEASPQK